MCGGGYGPWGNVISLPSHIRSKAGMLTLFPSFYNSHRPCHEECNSRRKKSGEMHDRLEDLDFVDNNIRINNISDHI